MVALIALLVIGGVVYRVTTPDERTRAARVAVAWLEWLRRLVVHETPASAAFGQALRERTRLSLATPLLVAAHLVLFGLMALAPGPIARSETLIGWGASFGPRTTNGEWWRFVTATFVQAGLPTLVVNMVGLPRGRIEAVEEPSPEDERPEPVVAPG